MTPPRPIVIEALVPPAEQAALIAGCEQLCEHLEAVSAGPWSVELRLREHADDLGRDGPADAVFVSLLPEVEGGEDLAAVEARLEALLERLAPSGPVYLLTVFRHAPPPAAPGLRERILRLGLMVARLSHATGAYVADIDRVFAHVGARPIETDWRLGGRKAAETAGHVIVTALLTGGLDEAVPPQAQELALARHGGLAEIGLAVGRRLARQRA